MIYERNGQKRFENGQKILQCCIHHWNVSNNTTYCHFYIHWFPSYFFFSFSKSLKRQTIEFPVDKFHSQSTLLLSKFTAVWEKNITREESVKVIKLSHLSIPLWSCLPLLLSFAMQIWPFQGDTFCPRLACR